MSFIRYRAEDTDGTFLDEFSTNASDIAEERIGKIRSFHPGLTVTETNDDQDGEL